MESFFTRYRNVTVLLGLLMAQIIILATQVRRPEHAAGESMSLLRFWVVEAFVPGEKAISAVGSGIRNVWTNYVDLRGVRSQNEDLQEEIDRLRLEEVSLAEDAGQARRLQALLAFKEKFISQTVAAQVIGTSGSEHSHVLYIDKGSNDAIKADMAVITPQGIIGKVAKAFPGTSQVLEINDVTAGAGVMLERSRLRGVLHGTNSGIPEILHIMADEKVEHGEPVVSSGGDQIYPRGLPIGTVFSTGPDPEGGPFMVVRVKPSANLDKVEEVLVIIKVIDKSPERQETATGLRAADILAQRLPTVVPKPPDKANEEPPSTAVLYGHAAAAKPPGTGTASTSSTNPQKAPSAPIRTQPGTAPQTSSDDADGTPMSSAPQQPKATTERSATSGELKSAVGAENAAPAVTQSEKPKPLKPASAPGASDNPPPQETPR